MTQFANNPDQDQNMVGGYQSVTDRVDTIQAFTDDRWAETYQFTQDYKDFLTSLVVPTSNISDVVLPDITPLNPVLRPQLGDLDLDTSIPSFGVSPLVLAPPIEFSGVDIPVITFQPPNWNTPEKPISSTIANPGSAPIINETTIPTAPSVSLPSPPIFQNIDLPDSPNITLPEFDGVLPSDIGDLNTGFSYSPEAYNSDVWSDLLNKVLHDIRNGGTGLSVIVEKEIYERALARQQSENDRMYQEVENKFGSSGFDLPNGALTSSLLQISEQITRNNTEINGQIAIDQAKLAQDNTHFMLDKGIQLEGVMREFYQQSEGRALEASKTIVSVAIDVYNSAVSKFNALNDRYKSEAMVFEARTKAALTEIEIFKGQIESARVSSDVQKNLVAVYNAQLGAIETQMKIYVTEMEGAKVHSDVELSKIEIFKSQIQAYTSQLDAKKIEFDIYATEWQGEQVKADVYKSQVSAYVAEVSGAKAQADIVVAEADVTLKNNGIKIEEYKALIQAYLAEIDSKIKKTSIQVEGFKAEARAYESETSALGMYYGTKAKEMEVLLSESDVKIKQAIAEVDATTQGYVALKGIEAVGHKGIMDMGAQLVSSAMNAVNTSLSLGSSYQWSKGINQTTGSSLSETHTYEEKKI